MRPIGLDCRQTNVPAFGWQLARTLALRWGAFPIRPNPADIDEFVDQGLGLAEDPETRLWLLAMKGAAGIRWGPGRLSDPQFIADRSRAVTDAVEGARQLGLPDLLVVAGRISGQLEFAAGRYRESAAAFRELIPHLDAVESDFARALTALYITLALADIEGAYADALVIARRVLDMGRKLSPHEHAHGTSAVLWCLYHLGEWSETGELVDEHLDAVRGTDVFICPYMRSGPLIGALIAAHLGDFRRANDLFDQVALSEEQPGLPESLHAMGLMATGQAEAGVAAAQRIIDSGRLPSMEENSHEAIALVEGLLATRDWARLRAFLPDARRLSASLAILGPFCDRAEARLAAADGDTERATELLRIALSGFERLGVPYQTAQTKALLASVLPDGDAMLMDAVATAETLMGDRTPEPPAPQGTAPRDDDSLTAREREILELIGEGISNQEIANRLVLSPRTVERHVSNIYLKLGLEGRSSRAAAASYAVRSSLKDGRP